MIGICPPPPSLPPFSTDSAYSDDREEFVLMRLIQARVDRAVVSTSKHSPIEFVMLSYTIVGVQSKWCIGVSGSEKMGKKRN